MVRQTTLNGRAQTASDGPLGRHLSRLAGDVLTLAECQSQLFAEDLQSGGRRLMAACGVLLCGLALLLAGLPVALVAAAEGLAVIWPRPAAYGIAGGAAMVLAAGLMLLGWKLLLRGLHRFRRSKNELAQNVHCLKALLKSHSEKKHVPSGTNNS